MNARKDMHIALSGVTHRYGERIVLDNLSLDLREQRIGIIGANGSGKSTFARLLNGLIVPEAGEVRINGLSTRTDLKKVRRTVGFVFQNPDHQIVMPTVAEDLAFGLENLRMDKQDIAERVEQTMAAFHLTAYANQPAHLMSGGEKQLLALAGVLIMEPEMVVLDEVTTLLDLRNTLEIAKRIDSLPQTVVFITHDLDLLQDFDRVIAFDQARVLADGPPDDTIRRYREHMLNGASRETAASC